MTRRESCLVAGGGGRHCGWRRPSDLIGFDEHDRAPASAAWSAAEHPAMPPPTIATSGALLCRQEARARAPIRRRRCRWCAAREIVVQGKMHGPATVRHFQVCRTGCVASDFLLV